MTPEQAKVLITLAKERNSFLHNIAWFAGISTVLLLFICVVLANRLSV